MHSEPSSLHRLIYSMAERILAQSELLSRRAEKPMIYTCGPCGVKRNLWNACPGIVPRATTCHDCGAQAVFTFNSDKAMTEVSHAFKAGFIAADKGGSSSDNPHDRYTPEYDSWLRGFEERTAI